MKKQTKILLLIGIIVLIPILIFSGLIAFRYFITLNQKNQGEEGVVCTMDAKECPDGSYVGRTGPNCEFTACPATNVVDWTKYSEDELMTMAEENWKTEAMFFKGISGNFLIIDQGTAPDPRGLIIYDLNAKKEVLSDKYSSPLDITSTAVSYWNPTSQKVTVQNCPDSVTWEKQGLGAEIEAYVSFDLTTLTKKDLGQTRCKVTQ